LAAKAARSSAR